MTVYLCGPINGRSDEECKDWREIAKNMLINTINPMDRDYRGREIDPGIASEIVENDKNDILKSSSILVYYDKPSVGTSMEILFAFERNIPVYLVNKSDKPLSPWLIYHSTKIFVLLEDACDYITGK